MKNNNHTKIPKVLISIASLSCESASFFCLYEPKLPKQLLNKNRKAKNSIKENV